MLRVFTEVMDRFALVLLLLLLLLLSLHHFFVFTQTVFLQTKMRNMKTPRSRLRMSTVRKK